MIKMLPQDAMKFVVEHALYFTRSGPNHPAGEEYQYIKKDAKSATIAYLRAGEDVHIAVASCYDAAPTLEQQATAIRHLQMELLNKLIKRGLVLPSPPAPAPAPGGAHGP